MMNGKKLPKPDKKNVIDLDTFLPLNLRIVAASISTISQSKIFSSFDLSIAEWRVLLMVYGVSGISASTIADKLGSDRPAISRAITKLIRKGYLVKTFDLKDQRRQQLMLSESGLELYESLVPAVKEFVVSLTKYVSKEEVGEMQASLRKLQRALDEM